MSLEKFKKQIYCCAKIGSCKILPMGTYERPLYFPACPIYEKYLDDAHYAGGILYLARRVLEGQLKFSSDLAEVLFSCTTCGMCDEVHERFTYPGTIPVLEIIEEFRTDLVKADFTPDAVKRVAANIAENHNPFGEPEAKRFTWLAEDIPTKADVIYFVGCVASYKTPEIAQAVVKILKTAGVKFGIMRSEECCGEPLWRMGLRDEAEEQLRKALNGIEKAGAKAVVFSDPHAYSFMKQKLADMRVKGVHITELVSGLLKEGKLKLKKVEGKVTYHDPSYLGRRGSKVYGAPREIIKALGAELIEMPRNREWAWPSGAEGGIYFINPEFTRWCAQQRLREIKEGEALAFINKPSEWIDTFGKPKRLEEAKGLEVDTLVTASPLDKVAFTEAGKGELKIADVTELVAGAI